MKTKKINKKISLNKVTVTNLSGLELGAAAGGILITGPVGTLDTACDTCTFIPYCPDNPTAESVCNYCPPEETEYICTSTIGLWTCAQV